MNEYTWLEQTRTQFSASECLSHSICLFEREMDICTVLSTLLHTLLNFFTTSILQDCSLLIFMIVLGPSLKGII